MLFVKPILKTGLLCALSLGLYGCGESTEDSVENVNDNNPTTTEQAAVSESPYPTVASLGKALFNDVNLSNNRTQSCATCHAGAQAFTDPRHHSRGNGEVAVLVRETGVSVGDDHFSIGTRNAPSAAYAALNPQFALDDQGYIGGQFWDGRASSLEDQAGGPPLNPLEMQMPDKASVIARIRENSDYIAAFQQHYGEDIFNQPEPAFAAITQAIAAFEKSDEFQTFDSKWDRYLAGTYRFNAIEQAGYELFKNKNCIVCHSSHASLEDPRQTFTNYRYNLGLPRNTRLIDENESRGLNSDFVLNGDRGLFDNPEVSDLNEIGKFKTPTLRNIAVTGPYMHNGVFQDLQQALIFLNEGRADAQTPFPETLSKHIHAQGMNAEQLNQLECFLRTLTDQAHEGVLAEERSDGSRILCRE